MGTTVSATFMIVVAKTLGLMEIWNAYFWVTLFVTFLVTAITVRIWPLSKVSEDYYNGQEGSPEEIINKDRLKVAWGEAMTAAQNTKSLASSIWMNLKDGCVMTMSILPSIMYV